jgi:DNA-binding MarR family transcriptional regulator
MSRQRNNDGLMLDHVEQRRRQWSQELPEVDTVGMAVLGRARWITLQVRPAIERVFELHGLDTGEFDVLSTLLRSGPPYRLRPTELYRSLMISSGGLTDRLTRLEKAGLVRRVRSDADARSLLVELTASGRKRAELAFRDDMAVEKTLLSALTAEERAELGRLLAKLATQVAEKSKSP